uniref:Glutamine synthetase n=1 Tax=Angiostrongylus cantonensis TaxID=6313 RepID=A0A0K0D6V1_ANGCA
LNFELFPDLGSLSDAEGRPLSEIVAMAVGKLGENLSVRNIKALYAPEGATLYSAAHPRGGSDDVNMGKYVSVVALRRPETKGVFPTEKLAGQLCQTTNIDEDETALLRQTFMLNPSQTVYEYVRDHQAEIVDFFRSELGGYE